MKTNGFLAILGLIVAAGVLFTMGSTGAAEREFDEKFASAESAAQGESGVYDFDAAHTFIGFRVKHMGLIEVPGYFRGFTGRINYEAKEPAKSSVEFTAKVATIDTGVERRDNHLRSADFFEVEKYPELTFRSSKVEKTDGGWMVTGDLTMKGVTKTLTFPFNITGFIPGGERVGTRMGVTSGTSLNRRDYGITYGGNVAGTEIPTIGDEIKVWLQIEALRQREEAKPATD
jgi:polyisoprenoid-binding protein YceI